MIVTKHTPENVKLTVELTSNDLRAISWFVANTSGEDLADNLGSWADCNVVYTLLELISKKGS